MFKSKNLNILFLTLIIFSIPFFEFLSNNINEINIILGKSFYFLVIFAFFFISFGAYIISFLSKKLNFVESLLISMISFWIFFKHNLINQFFKRILEDNIFGEKFSSEIALLVILISIIFIFIFIKRDSFFFKRFCLIFFYLSFFYIISQIIYSKIFFKDTKIENNNSINYIDRINKKKPNIYFFILDAMQPIDGFEKYYNIEMNSFLNEYKKNGYLYLQNSSNLYGNTTYGLSAIFHLDKILDNNKKIKINSGEFFPNILRANKQSNLISNLNNLNYDFKWIGNYFAYCPKFNLKHCLNQDQDKIIDNYLYVSFFKKSPLIQIITNLGYLIKFDFDKYLFYELHDGMGRLNDYINNQNIEKPTFYFIHHMSPHWPYVTNSDCSYKNFPGEENYEGYKSAYLCNLKKINETIKILEKKDPKAFVVFQSDHNWQMSKNDEEKKLIFNLVKKKNNCKFNQNINYDNVNTLRLILSCITGNNPKYIIE